MTHFSTAASILAIMLSACATTAPEPASAELTPAAIRAMIARDGAAATIEALTSDGGEGNAFLSVGDAISKGEQAWLDIVPLLDSGADDAAADVLTMALAIALPDNPAGVLRLVTAQRSVTEICTNRLIDPSPEDALAFKNRAIAAVDALRDPEFAQPKRGCLASLRR